MNTCRTCRWWGRYRDGCCDRVDTNSRDAEKLFEIDVRVADDTGLDAYLKTGPDFGCVLWDEPVSDYDEFKEDEDD